MWVKCCVVIVISFAVLNKGSLFALFLRPIISINAFFVIFKFFNKYNHDNPIVLYQDASEGRLDWNIINVIYLAEENVLIYSICHLLDIQ